MARVDLEKYRESGRIAAEAHALAKERIRPGGRLVDVLDAIEDFIHAQGADRAFPAQISVNEVAAHDCCGPDDPRVFGDDDVIKVDLGVHVDGCIADTARTHDLGNKHGALLEASRQALEAAIERVRPGARIKDIGGAIKDTMVALGFKPVANLTGHGIAPYTIHCSPSIPNVPDMTSGVLKEGMMICIEPFATTGRGHVVEQGRAEVFGARRKLKPPRNVSSDVIDQILDRRGLPFCRREIAKEHGTEVADRALRDLLRAGSIHDYPPLVESHGKGAFVAQFEHTIHVTADGSEVMTRDR